LGKLSALSDLFLFDNILSGTIPPELGNLNGLVQFNINGNYFSKMLPSLLGNLSELKYGVWEKPVYRPLAVLARRFDNINGSLAVWENGLTGSLPPDVYGMRALAFLHLGGNKFTGPLLSWLGNLTTLTDLLLNDNQFNGTFLSSLGHLTALT
ncbi:hypothetical protein ACHAWX_000088, partial [Stephanocyclus meneghinianus]